MTTLRYFNYCILIALGYMGFSDVSVVLAETGTVPKLRYARNFEITDFPTHRIASVYASGNDPAPLFQYALVSREAPLPELPEDITVIRTPVEHVVVLETIYVGFLEALDQLETITGAGTADYICNQTILRGIESGSVQKVKTGQMLDIERLVLLEPELIFTSVPSEPTLNIPAQLDRANLPVVVTAAYRERHPLARAEWIKFIAAFFDASKEADEIFDSVANRYESLLQKMNDSANRPTVFCGAPYSGVWHMVEGDSYMSQLIEDAGGDYLWSHTHGTGTIPLNVERVFLKAVHADVWLNPGVYRSKQSLFSADPRFAKFQAAQTGNIYNNTRQQLKNTGNPIWETGVVRPDDLLADLIKILHPDRMPDWKFVYYERLK